MLKTTREQLEKLKALEAQATPGPWSFKNDTDGFGDSCEVLVAEVGKSTPDEDPEYDQVLFGTCFPESEVGANWDVIAESRNALDALLHDAAVAHRLVAGVREVLTALNRRSEGYRSRPFDEYDLGAHDEVDDCRTMLEALLSAAKGAE